jgi:haloalkane dehalogenase
MSEAAIEEYWKGFADETRRRGHLELYRSGDFDKLLPYEGRVAALGVPTLILWGDQDRFASVRMAHRFHGEIPGSELQVLAGAGHFVWDDEPQSANEALVDFLQRRAP